MYMKLTNDHNFEDFTFIDLHKAVPVTHCNPTVNTTYCLYTSRRRPLYSPLTIILAWYSLLTYRRR
jgi:hypothetical protein